MSMQKRTADAPKSFRRHFRTAVWTTSLVALCATSATAFAQSTDTEPGVPVGPLIISPALRLGIGYDNNVSLNAKNEVSASSPEFLIAPNVTLNMRESSAVRFSAGAGIAWRQYFAGEQGAKDSSGMDANARAALQVNYGGPVSFTLDDHLRQSNDAVYVPDLNNDIYQISFSEYGLDLGSGRVLNNSLGAGLKFHPGGDNEDTVGFVGSLKFTHNYAHYQERPSSDRQRIGGALNLGWRFLPRSTVFFDASSSRVLYREDYTEPVTRDVDMPIDGAAQNALKNNESTPLYLGVGLRTLLTQRLGMMTRLGYSTAFYDEGQSPKRFAFQLQFDAAITDSQKLRFGYATNYADSTFSNYLTYHRFHASYTLDVQRLHFSLSAFAQINKYATFQDEALGSGGNVIEIYNTTNRRDVPVGASADLRVNMSRNFAAGVSYSLLTNMSNFDAEPAAGWVNGNKLSGSPEFLRHRVSLYLTMRL